MDRIHLEPFFDPFPVLETPRLILRQMKITDTDDMYEYAQSQEITEYLLWRPHPSSDVTRRYLKSIQKLYRKGKMPDWALENKENGKMIGTCGFADIDENNFIGEVGYVLNKNYWGRGLAAEALSAVIDFGFKVLELQRIEARFMVGNGRSKRVMEKCGMNFEGILRSSMYVKDRFRDIGICSILRSEYI